MGAFAVFADGLYRYPDNEDFLNNTFTTFYQSLQKNWNRKNWPDSDRLIEEMNALEILKKQDYRKIRKFLIYWQGYLSNKNDQQFLKQVNRLLKIFSD
jgi:hypothetical protein